MATLKELREIRLQKLEELKYKGINPYPEKSNRTDANRAITQNFESYENKEVVVAGRIMALREHGKLAFIDLQDESGKIQLYIKADNLGGGPLSKSNDKFPFSEIHLLDIGDFVESKGVVVKTQRGEISIESRELRLLAKSLRPIPTKWDGFVDIERRYRRRYLDMTINTDVREVLRKKGIFIQSMREFLLKNGFSEVETSVLENVTGGAEARPFITHYNALDMDVYLRISLELPLKRLIAGGMEKVFEIGRVFRNEGMSMMHLQHYTQLEFYWAYADFDMLISFVEELYVHAIKTTFGSLKFNWQGKELDFTPPWPRIDYQKEFLKATGIDLALEYTREDLLNAGKMVGVTGMDPKADIGRLIDQIYKKTIREKIVSPVMLVNHPVIISPLAKRDDKNQNIVRRFQPVMLGAEVGNGWSELNDPIDQLQRFREQQELIEKGDDEAMMMDIDYIEAMEYGMPPNAGFGVGFDRFFMYLADLPTIRDTLYFPVMKPFVSQTTREIYDLKKIDETIKSTNAFVNLDENKKRFAAVLNKEFNHGQLMNALAHMSSGLSSGLLDQKDIVLVDYLDKADEMHAILSHYPYIILEAKNSNAILKLRKEAKERGIKFIDFTDTMFVGSTKDQVRETQEKNEDELNYVGILMFGDTVQIKELTKKFSLLK